MSFSSSFPIQFSKCDLPLSGLAQLVCYKVEVRSIYLNLSQQESSFAFLLFVSRLCVARGDKK
jgi:hypothetical protein